MDIIDDIKLRKKITGSSEMEKVNMPIDEKDNTYILNAGHLRYSCFNGLEFNNECLNKETIIDKLVLRKEGRLCRSNDMKKINVDNDVITNNLQNEYPKNERNNKVFIVHGHDNEAKQEVARMLEKVGLHAIILNEQANLGNTIIEKLERCTNVSYAIVLYTECDRGRSKYETVNEEKNRARQNVIYEHGYLIGKLGRDRVFVLVKGDVEIPGDISGIVYTKMDEAGAWKLSLAKEMKTAGLKIDINDCV